MAVFDLPDRAALRAIQARVQHVRAAAALGFTRLLGDDHVFTLFLSRFGVAAHVAPTAAVPTAMWAASATDAGVPRQVGDGEPDSAAAWQLAFYGVQRLCSVPVPDVESPTRFWIGASTAAPFEPPEVAGMRRIAEDAARLFTAPLAPDVQLERLQRLDRTAALVPSLLHVLDVRDVFARLSEVARLALPHDLLLLREFSDDLTTARVHALSDGAPVVHPPAAHGYPPSIVQAWEYSIVDDLASHPLEAEAALARLGARSVLRLSIRFDRRTIGGLAFLSFAPGAYDSTDVAVARRLADHVALALSHHRLAEDRRDAAALRERTTNLEMLDGLLGTLAGVLDVREVFARVSTVAQKVLPHDGLSILELLADGSAARVHASHGLGEVAEFVPMPVPALDPERVDIRIVDDYADRPEYARGPGAAAGMRSSLFVSILVEGRPYGGVNFYSRTPGRFTKDDVLVARRITDHVALALSHRRLADEMRTAQELRAQATTIELLDGLLATLIDAEGILGTFERISAIARKVIAHDAMALPVFLPGGTHARRYAAIGLGIATPEVIDIPPVFTDPAWDHDLIDDVGTLTGTHNRRAAELGFRAVIRIPIRLDGKPVAVLVFLCTARGAFTPADVKVARRIADRLAITLARDVTVAASKRADEATERAARLEARVRALTDELDARTGYRRVIGESTAWRQVLTQATQVAATDTTALLLGESGTGKEVVARFIHRASTRRNGPFVALNCAALPEQLLEAELFGYERGAFTGATQSKPGQLEQAAGGTLFLDEVGEMSPTAQAKFLRVLQEREFQRLGGTRVLRSEARIVAATNRDLSRAIAQQQFREDLYYRLNVFAIRLPALRDRRDDILPLADAFLAEVGKGLGRPPGGISRDAREMLLAYAWPGNVRELRNALERAAILCEGGLITADLLALHTSPPPSAAAAILTAAVPAVASAPPLSGGVTNARAGLAGPPASADDLAALEKSMIEQALAAARFNKSKAATALGLTRHQLYIRMRRHGLE